MRIIFLEVSQDLGGAQKSTLELAKRLKVLGHQVLIVDLWGCSQSFIDATNTAQLELNILSYRKEPFIITNDSKIKLFRNFIWYFFLEKKYKYVLNNLISNFQPNVVAVHNVKALSLLNPKGNYKIDFFARGWFDYGNMSSLSKKTIKRYNPRFLAASQSTRQALFTGGLAKLKDIKVLTSVIESAISNTYENKYDPFSNQNPIKILFSGGFLKTKGQHTCVYIAKKLKEKNICFKMTLTGILYRGDESKKYYHHILNLISKYDLENSVKIVLSPQNIMDYFKNTDILIHPGRLRCLHTRHPPLPQVRRADRPA